MKFKQAFVILPQNLSQIWSNLMQELITKLLSLDIQAINDETLSQFINELNLYFVSIKVQGVNLEFAKAEFILYELCKLPLGGDDYSAVFNQLNLIAKRLDSSMVNEADIDDPMRAEYIKSMGSIRPLRECIQSNFMVVDKEHIRKNLACFKIIKILGMLKKQNSIEEIRAIQAQCIELNDLFTNFFPEYPILNLQEEISRHFNDPANNNQLREFQDIPLPVLEKINIALIGFSENNPSNTTQFLINIVTIKLQDPTVVKNEICKKISDALFYILEPEEDDSGALLTRNIDDLQDLLIKHPDITHEDIIPYYQGKSICISLGQLTNLLLLENKLPIIPMPDSSKNLLIAVINSQKNNPSIIKKHVYDSIAELVKSINNCKLKSEEKIKIKIKLNDLDVFLQEKFPESLPQEMIKEIDQKIKDIYIETISNVSNTPNLQSALGFMNKIFNSTSKINPVMPSSPTPAFMQIVNRTRAKLIVAIINENYNSCKKELEAIYEKEKPQDYYRSFDAFIRQSEEPQGFDGNFFVLTITISPKLESAIKNYKAIQRLSPVLNSNQDPIDQLKAIKNIYDLPATQNDLRSSAEMSTVKLFKRIGYYLSSIFSNNFAQSFLTPQKRFNKSTHKILESALDKGIISNDIPLSQFPISD